MSKELDISGYLIPVDVLDKELQKQGFTVVSTTAIGMLTVSGYIQRWHDNISITMTYEKAWEVTEDEFRTNFKTQRFDNYQSFRTSSTVVKYLKNGKKK